jgi:hypothetical protein
MNEKRSSALRFNKKLIAALTSLALMGCAADVPPSNTDSGSKLPPGVGSAPSSVVFFDSDVFDNQLARSLQANHSEVIVKPSSPITINGIPVRLNTWLIAVQHRGGNVNLVALRKGPNGQQEQFVQLLIPIAFDVIAKFVSAKINASASSDDATKNIVDYLTNSRHYFGLDKTLVTIRYHDKTNVIENISFRKL